VLRKVGDGLSPRTGRPKAENPKCVSYSIRLDVGTEQRLREYCQEHNITRGEAIRQGIELLLDKKK
jgi:predicted DNA-binding protein